MDQILMAFLVGGGFTLFGYIWGRYNITDNRSVIEHTVNITLENLVKEGYLKVEIKNDKSVYAKWPVKGIDNEITNT